MSILLLHSAITIQAQGSRPCGISTCLPSLKTLVVLLHQNVLFSAYRFCERYYLVALLGQIIRITGVLLDKVVYLNNNENDYDRKDRN